MAFFIGFNNNQAYDRWWEARKIWGGIVNDSRSFARMVLTQIPSSNDPEDEISRMKKRLQAIDLEYLYKNNYIDGFKYLEFNKMLINFTDLMGKSERIKGTVFPTTYRYYTYIFWGSFTIFKK